ncbi:hypothetical protein LLG95_02240 [bacterium]|nr:hypothetical protein [bacterium]
MMLRKLSGILAVWVLCLTVAIAQPPAGDQPAGAPPDQQGQVGQDQGRRPRQFDPAQMQQRMQEMQQRRMEQMKTRLNATDDEWKAIEPLLQNVMKAQREATPGRGMMGMGGRRGRGMGGPEGQGGPQGGPAPQAAQAQEMPERAALQTAADDPNAKPEDIKAKLKAYREAMAKKQEALKEARNKLREVLSASQEAKLVLDGTLD